MAGGYWHISDRILKRGTIGYDFIGTTPFISVNADTHEFDLSEIKVIFLDIKETPITLDGSSYNYITTPVFLECEGFSQDDGALIYTGKASSSFGTPVDLKAYVYFGGDDIIDPKKVPIIAIEFEGVTSGGGDNNN